MQMNSTYNVGMSNCQHFSEAIFKEMSLDSGSYIKSKASIQSRPRHYNSCNVCDRRYIIQKQIKLLEKDLVQAGIPQLHVDIITKNISEISVTNFSTLPQDFIIADHLVRGTV